MKRILILIAMVALGAFALNGCSSEADATVTCEGGCGMEMAKADAKEIEGKFYCSGCATHMAGEAVEEHASEHADMVKCAGGCGMEMATADAKEVDGKHYCAACAVHAGHDH